MADLVTFARSPLGQDITLDPNAGGILIQGATGSGKSSCALSIALSLARMGFSLCCLNPNPRVANRAGRGNLPAPA